MSYRDWIELINIFTTEQIIKIKLIVCIFAWFTFKSLFFISGKNLNKIPVLLSRKKQNLLQKALIF